MTMTLNSLTMLQIFRKQYTNTPHHNRLFGVIPLVQSPRNSNLDFPPFENSWIRPYGLFVPFLTGFKQLNLNPINSMYIHVMYLECRVVPTCLWRSISRPYLEAVDCFSSDSEASLRMVSRLALVSSSADLMCSFKEVTVSLRHAFSCTMPVNC